MEQRYYYAQVKEDEYGNLVCISTLDTFEEKQRDDYILIDVVDVLMVGRKMWTGEEWVDNPNYKEPEELEE